MMMKIKNIISLFPLLLFFCFGCNGSDSPDDTPTYGQISISVDETFKPLIDSEIFTFEGIYNYACGCQYKTEMEAFNDLMNDTIRLIIVPRQLNKDELKEFEKWEIVPKVTKIAYDAVALIGSKDLKDSTLTLDEIKSLLSDGSVHLLKMLK
jgi:phosphate transport system substrate-binding protein